MLLLVNINQNRLRCEDGKISQVYFAVEMGSFAQILEEKKSRKTVLNPLCFCVWQLFEQQEVTKKKNKFDVKLKSWSDMSFLLNKGNLQLL